MSVAYVGHGANQIGDGTALVHASTVVGDQLILVVSGRADGAATVSVAGAWNLLEYLSVADSSSRQHLWVYEKVADAADISSGVALDFDPAFSASNRVGDARVSTFSGVVYVGDTASVTYGESGGGSNQPIPLAGQPVGEGMYFAVRQQRGTGGVGTNVGGFASRYSDGGAGSNRTREGLTGNYDELVSPVPPRTYVTAAAQIGFSVILSGTALPAPRRGPFIGLRVN